MKCAIIASGDFHDSGDTAAFIRSCDLVICADGGARHLVRLEIVPHVLIGDFDSIEKTDRQFFENKEVTILSFPSRKDKTDTELCIDFAMEQGGTDITLFGASGTRMDHTLSNIFLLEKLARLNISARLINETNEIYLVKDTLVLSGKPGGYLSLLPLSQTVLGVTVDGLEYPLNNARMTRGSSIGISNVFKTEKAVIRVQKGVLIVTKSKDSAP